MEAVYTVQQYINSAQQRVLPSHLLPRAACTVCTFVTQRLFCCTPRSPRSAVVVVFFFFFFRLR